MTVQWNDALNQEFIAMRGRVSVQEMAMHFGTSVGAIYAHGRVIGCLVMDRNPMAPEVRAELQAATLAGATDAELAKKFNRSIGSIRWHLEQLGLTGTRRPPPKTADELARLRHLVQVEGRTRPELRALLGFSEATLRKHLDKLGLRPPRVINKPSPSSKGSKPRRVARAIAPLAPDQVDTVKSMLGKASLMTIAAAINLGVKVMKLRAAAAGLDVSTSLRREGKPLTRHVLSHMAANGLTPYEAGRQLGRDARTVRSAAEAFGVTFPRKTGKVPPPGPVLPGRKAEDRTKAANGPAPASPLSKASCGSGKGETVPITQERLPPLAARSGALQPDPRAHRGRRPAAAAPAGSTSRPKVVQVMEAPAAPKPPMPAAEKRPKRWNRMSMRTGKPEVILVQAEVDAAVARFIAERGVTRRSEANPVEAAITAARRMGFIVLRDGDGFVLDNRIRLASGEELQDWVARRSELKMSA